MNKNVNTFAYLLDKSSTYSGTGIYYAICLCIIFVLGGCGEKSENFQLQQGKNQDTVKTVNRVEKPIKTATARVVKVIDGDTFETDKGEKVRILGIDTPEMRESEKLTRDMESTKKDIKTITKLGELSFKYSQKLLLNKTVTLEIDEQGDEKDKYGRLLRYVYLPNGELFNEKIIREGYAYAYTRFPYSKLEDFRKAERYARENKNGLWGDKDFKEGDQSK